MRIRWFLAAVAVAASLAVAGSASAQFVYVGPGDAYAPGYAYAPRYGYVPVSPYGYRILPGYAYAPYGCWANEGYGRWTDCNSGMSAGK
jgi:hypothetical protein